MIFSLRLMKQKVKQEWGKKCISSILPKNIQIVPGMECSLSDLLCKIYKMLQDPQSCKLHQHKLEKTYMDCSTFAYAVSQLKYKKQPLVIIYG